jgi:flagellar export protein FliJ
MKRFKFLLESALHHRIRLEEAAVQELARWKRCHIQINKKLDDLRSKRADVEMQASNVSPDLASFMLQVIDQRMEWLLDQEAVCHKELACLAMRLEEARHAVIAAATARRSLERLKERQLVEHTAQINAKEQKELDDIAGLRKTRLNGSAALGDLF